MSAYVPSLTIEPATEITKTRLLPVPGKCLVKKGDVVKSDTAVLKADLPGDLEILRVAELLDLEPEDVIKGLKIKKGQKVSKGDLLCSARYFFGMLSAELEAKEDGTIEFINEQNAHLGLRLPSRPLEVDAYIPGEVSEIKEGSSVSITCRGALLQGIFGVGGERSGEILPLEVPRDKLLTEADIPGTDIQGKILIGGSSFSEAALKLAAEKKVAGVITASIDALTLKNFVGYDIGVSITGDEDVPFTLIVSEGFGKLSMSERFFDLATSLAGKSASLNGATQIRAGATRPELIVATEVKDISLKEPTLEPGSKIRIIRVPYFGLFGEITELPHEPEVIPSGAKVRILRAKLGSGEVVTVPRANVELV